MKILILGGSGMLGHRLWINLQKNHEVYVTVRNQTNPFPDIPEFPKDNVICGVEGLITESVLRAITRVRPEVVINCIGLIKHLNNSNPLDHIRVNALLPHLIALWCGTANIRMIHISTDCVFSGKTGNYTEKDFSDAIDLYGRTKFLGEVDYPPCITLRTSIIGFEIKNYAGLMEWFMRQENSVKGYTNAIYSGFTTDELACIIDEHILPKPYLYGMFHVSSNSISKYGILALARFTLGKSISIERYDDFYCNRSLNSEFFRRATGYEPPAWETMMYKLANTYDFYKKLKEETWQNGRLPVRL